LRKGGAVARSSAYDQADIRRAIGSWQNPVAFIGSKAGKLRPGIKPIPLKPFDDSWSWGLVARKAPICLNSSKYNAVRAGVSEAKDGAKGPAWGRSLSAALLVATTVAVMAAGIAAVLRVPGVPHDAVSELFAGSPTWMDLIRFSLMLLSIGMGARFAAYLASIGRFGPLVLPLWCIVAVLITLGLAQHAVSTKTYADFTGSAPTLYREIVHNRLWGATSARLLAPLEGGWDGPLERSVRFVFLIAPLVLWLGIFQVSAAHPTPSAKLRSFLLYAASAVPWLFLFKWVNFDHPSTDNLVELIEPGAGAYLYALLMLVAFVSVLVGSIERFSRRGRLLTFGAFLLSVPIGWFLLKHGMVAALQKYGVMFSGIDFMLGPDRENKLPEVVLFERWSVLQIAATGGLGWSLWLAGHFMPRPPGARGTDGGSQASVGQPPSRVA
jgi:hypothetical protein